jgi:hypothetical protein
VITGERDVADVQLLRRGITGERSLTLPGGHATWVLAKRKRPTHLERRMPPLTEWLSAQGQSRTRSERSVELTPGRLIRSDPAADGGELPVCLVPEAFGPAKQIGHSRIASSLPESSNSPLVLRRFPIQVPPLSKRSSTETTDGSARTNYQAMCAHT